MLLIVIAIIAAGLIFEFTKKRSSSRVDQNSTSIYDPNSIFYIPDALEADMMVADPDNTLMF